MEQEGNMSGIYIKGMEMPKNCDECWTKFHGFGWVEHDEEWGTFYCKAGKGFCSDPRTKCPIVPVPDHGRLIDAYALMDALPDDFRIPSAAAKVIERTIIPLSKGGGT